MVYGAMVSLVGLPSGGGEEIKLIRTSNGHVTVGFAGFQVRGFSHSV